MPAEAFAAATPCRSPDSRSLRAADHRDRLTTLAEVGRTITLDVERPVAGRRAICPTADRPRLWRHSSERVAVRVERWPGPWPTPAVDVLVPSPDAAPRTGAAAPRLRAHRLRAAADAQADSDCRCLRRIGRRRSPPPPVLPSPKPGIACAIFAAAGRFGFFREGLHAPATPPPADLGRKRGRVARRGRPCWPLAWRRNRRPWSSPGTARRQRAVHVRSAAPLTRGAVAAGGG
jgi:hypothetical protein